MELQKKSENALPNAHRHFDLFTTNLGQEENFFFPSIYNISYFDFLKATSDYKSVLNGNKAHKFMVGLHPWESDKLAADRNNFSDFDATIRELYLQNQIVGIGEIGLDFSRRFKTNLELLERQKAWFAFQLQVACDLRLPITLHGVKAFDHILQIVKNSRPKGPIIFHRFISSPEFVKQLQKSCNPYFSISLPPTTNFTDSYISLIKSIPINRLLLEDEKVATTTEGIESYKIGFEKVAHLLEMDLGQLKEIVSNNIEEIFILLRGRC